MATLTPKTTCTSCHKIKVTYNCQGCSDHFCFDDLSEHRKIIQQEFDHLQNDHDVLRQQINDFKDDPTKYVLFKQIDQWELDSINKIKQQAQRCPLQFLQYSNPLLHQMEKHLNDLAQRIKEIHRENGFNEIDLNQLKQTAENLRKQLNQPTNFSIKRQSTSFIDKISFWSPFTKGKNQSDSIV